MNKMKKAIQSMSAMLAMLALVCVALVSFTACDDKEELSTLSGEEMVAHIKSIVLDENGEILYGESSTIPGLYAAKADHADEARELCEKLINEGWDGKDRKVTLPDNCGTVELKTSDVPDGVWCRVVFNVRDIPDFTLLVATPEYCDNNNYRTPTASRESICSQCEDKLSDSEKAAKKCDNCGHTW